MVSRDVQAAIETVIRDRLSAVSIVSVSTVRGENFDGDDILRVTVIVDSPVSDFDIGRLSGLVRHVRLKLDGEHEHAFPMISFRSRDEAGLAA